MRRWYRKEGRRKERKGRGEGLSEVYIANEGETEEKDEDGKKESKRQSVGEHLPSSGSSTSEGERKNKRTRGREKEARRNADA